MRKRLPVPLLIAGLALLVLPPVLLSLGLTMTSASEVVIFAIACMALNILVGHTGLVSFGHGRCPRGRDDLGRVRVPDPAATRRLLFAADAGAGGDALHSIVPLDRR